MTLAAGLLGGSAAPVAAASAQGDVGSALGDAGAAVAMMRLVAGSVPDTSMLPELARLVSPTESFEGGFGLSNAQVNTAAELPYERSIAQATPFGAALTGQAPSASGGLVQTAPPSNSKASAGPLDVRDAPVDALVHSGELRGDVHARWSENDGPCVGRVAAASTSTGKLWLGNAVVTLPDIAFSELDLPGLAPSLRPKGKLGSLGGLLAGTKPSDNGDGALLRIPRGLETGSTVEVVDVSKRKAMRSTSRVQASSIDLLPGSPLGMTATVRHAPKLTVTSTGRPKTSRIVNDTPIIDVRRGKSTLFRLDRTSPTQDIAIGVPKAAFTRAHRGKLRALPVVGGFAEGTTGRAVRLSQRARREVVDLFVLRLTAGGLNTRSTALQQPFTGHQVVASARLLDVQLLPTKALVNALKKQYEVPSTLAQYTLGEQVARAAAPTDGVQCGKPGAGGAGTAALPTKINADSPAAGVRPLLWGGVVLLLGGAVLLVALRPRRS